MSVTTIEWTKRPGTIGETWNPTTGCNKVDRGCKNCYAEIMHRRLQAMGQAKYAQDFLKGAVIHEDTLKIPMAWKKPRTVFVDSMSDLFHVNVPFWFIEQVIDVIEDTPQHTYLVLTKRPERAVEFWRQMWMKEPKWKPPINLWMGTSANDQESANIRIPQLLDLVGCLKFLSYEPATGPVDLSAIRYSEKVWVDALTGQVNNDGTFWRDRNRKLHWVIAGGESGPKAVPSNADWFRQVRDDCKATMVPFFFKQWGLYRPEPLSLADPRPMVKQKDKSYNVLDMEVWQQFPDPKIATA